MWAQIPPRHKADRVNWMPTDLIIRKAILDTSSRDLPAIRDVRVPRSSAVGALEHVAASASAPAAAPAAESDDEGGHPGGADWENEVTLL